MKKGIAIAGNMIVDTIYPIERYPALGQLTSIENPITKATGGAVCNVIVDLAKLDQSLQLTALGVIGEDADGKFIEEQLSQYPHINLSQVTHEGTTSFTAVMSDLITKQRTFFHFRGANALFDEKHIHWESLDVEFLHIGYLLLLDQLDGVDEVFGTKMARLLSTAQKRGIKTSIDIVSDIEERFKNIVPPALKYTDYCIINEIEAERTTGVLLRKEGELVEANIPKALSVMKEMGVAKWIVIHAPEGGYGLDCPSGEIVLRESLNLPQGYIKGTNGAGDAFCAGILYGAYLDQTLAASIELALACATCSLSEPGATEGMRNYEEVLKINQEMKRRQVKC